MTKLIVRYIAVLGAVVVAAWGYSWFAVPLIEGTVTRSTDVSFQPAFDAVQHRDQRFDLEQLLPSDAWEFGSCIRLETEQGQLFFKDYESLEDGRLQVSPLTIILDQQGSDEAESSPLVLRSPKGAVLRFSEEFSFGQSNPGKLEYTWLKDQVTIFKRASKQGDDQLEVQTQNVTIDLKQQRITTPHEVSFRMGPHYGSGKDLSLTLIPKSDPLQSRDSITSVGDLGLLELVTLNEMVIYPTKSMLERTKSRQTQGSQDSVALQSNSAAPDETSETLGGNLPNDVETTSEPLTIRCRGPFRFDFQSFTASFKEEVVVAHRAERWLDSDQLTCDDLTAVFGTKAPENGVLDLATEAATSFDKMNRLELQALQAIGTPAIFDLPSQSGYAEAGFMRFEPTSKRIILRDERKIHLKHRDQVFDAKELEYFFEEDGRIGRARAIGPGTFTRQDKNGRGPLTASWSQELRVRPDDNLKALSLYGDPVVTLGHDSTFRAYELHLWIDEIEESPRPQSDDQSWRIVPTKMLALPTPEVNDRQPLSFGQPDYLERQVLIQSSRLNVATRRLEVFFSTALVDGNSAATQGQGQIDGITSAQPSPSNGIFSFQNSAKQGNGSDARSTPNQQQLQCLADLTRVRLEPVGGEYRVEELTLGGNVYLEESETEKPTDIPLQMTGQVIQATSLGSDYFFLTIQGTAQEDAQVSARGLTLIGRQINLDQLANQAWIDGIGRAVIFREFPAIEALAIQNPALAAAKRQATKPTEVRWREKMVFDGQSVLISGDVKAEGTHWLDTGERMDWESNSGLLTMTLDRRIDLAEPKRKLGSEKPAEVAEILLDQQVVIKSETFDEEGFLSARDELRVPNLAVNQITGELKSVGAGTGRSVRLNAGELGQQPSEVAQADRQETEKDQLIFLDIRFAAGIVGNILRKEVHFVRQVDALVGPVPNWDSELDRSTDFTGGKDERAQMLCDRLIVLEWGDDLHGKPELEIQGVGNAFLTGQGFEATGAKVAYNQTQNMMILEGDQHAYAKLVQKVHGTSAGNWVEAKKIMYWRETGAIDLDEVAGGRGIINGNLMKSPRR